MTKHTLYVVIKVEVESELPIEEVIDELGSESFYTVDSTENVTVQNTEWIDLSTQFPNTYND